MMSAADNTYMNERNAVLNKWEFVRLKVDGYRIGPKKSLSAM